MPQAGRAYCLVAECRAQPSREFLWLERLLQERAFVETCVGNFKSLDDSGRQSL
jgi:hypothetical protein